MNQETQQFLNLRFKPARVTALQASWMSGFNEDDMSILADKRIFVPLNDYGSNTVKMYALPEVLAFAGDVKRLEKATRAIYERNFHKNQKRKSRGVVLRATAA